MRQEKNRGIRHGLERRESSAQNREFSPENVGVVEPSTRFFAKMRVLPGGLAKSLVNAPEF
jgi:hypothetical protein